VRFIRRPARAGLGLAAAALLISACGQPQAGSAVVWDTGRITDEAVAQQAQSLAEELGQPASPELTQFTVTRMAQNAVIEEAAQREGVQVSDGEVDRTIANLIEESGGQEQFAADAAAGGVPESEIRSQVRAGLLFQALGEKLDPNFDPVMGSAIANQYVVQTSNDMALTTNPRFGVWDPNRLTLVPDPNALSRPGDNELQLAPEQLMPSQ
jgi:hypothetical protein